MIDWPFILTITLPIFALTACLFFIPTACRYAVRYGFVDAPGGRKTHERPVPPVGGIVIFSIFVFFSFFIGGDFGDPQSYYIALFLILITGIIDDRSGVFPWLKFLIHFLAAFVLVVVGDARIENLGDLLGMGDIELGAASIPFSIACVVYIINAMNMMDGLDGLAAGKAFIIFLWFFFGALLSGWWEPTALLLILLACLLGFLFYNFRHRQRKKAIVFLGDAGSMAIGLTIAWFSINLTQGPMPVLSPAAVAWIIALPIIDAFGLLVARLKDRKHPFHPDRRHFHHHFIDNGFNVSMSVNIILTFGFLLGAVGFFGYVFDISESILGWAWIALWLSHAVLVMYPNRFRALLAKIHTQYVDKTPTNSPSN